MSEDPATKPTGKAPVTNVSKAEIDDAFACSAAVARAVSAAMSVEFCATAPVRVLSAFSNAVTISCRVSSVDGEEPTMMSICPCRLASPASACALALASAASALAVASASFAESPAIRAAVSVARLEDEPVDAASTYALVAASCAAVGSAMLVTLLLSMSTSAAI